MLLAAVGFSMTGQEEELPFGLIQVYTLRGSRRVRKTGWKYSSCKHDLVVVVRPLMYISDIKGAGLT